jgi:beta-glucosidase
MLDFDMKTSPGRTYRYYTGEPEFPFAFGLSYAETSTKIVSHQNDGNGVSVTIEITNHDKNRTTDEIVTLFATAQSGVIDSSEPASQVQTSLVAFERVGPIAPSSSNTTVTLRVDPDVIALTDTDGHSKVYTGKYNIFLSVSSNDDDDDDNSVVVQCDKGSCSVA